MIKDLLPIYDVMFQVYRETIAAKVGNFDEFPGFVIDLMLHTQENRGK
jgi:hypothetical protein